MVAQFLLCLALLLSAIISRAADSSKSTPDMAGSPEWVHRKLFSGEADAVFDLGYKYLAGDGVPQDVKKAIGLISSATSQSPRAECGMGVAFANGLGVPHDDTKAMDWYRAAARDGCAQALHFLGRAYWEGLGTPPDYTKAFNCIRQAAEYGYPPAQSDLGFAYREAVGTETNLVESLKWLQLAANAGCSNASTTYNEVTALLDASQKQEVNHRVAAYQPLTNYAPVLDTPKEVTVPLGNFFQIPVKIFGKTNSLIVDTGASHLFLDTSFQDRLGEPLASIQGTTTTSSTATFGFRDCPEIFIGGRRFAPLLSVVEDFKNLQHASGESILGVLGMSCLKYEVLCFDADHNSFSMGGSVPEAVKKTALALPLVQADTFNYGMMVSINDRGPIFLAMDSGDAGCIDLNKTDWQKIFSGKPVKSRLRNSMDAEGKVVEGLSARLQSLTLGTNRYHDLIAHRQANSEISSRFGQEFIQRHVCYVDFPNRMLYLLPGRDFDRSEEYDMSGLELLKVDEKITVYSADKDAPAYQAGIRANDQILSINGQDTASLSQELFRERLKAKPGDEIKMQVKHGAQTNSVTFRLKRLL